MALIVTFLLLICMNITFYHFWKNYLARNTLSIDLYRISSIMSNIHFKPVILTDPLSQSMTQQYTKYGF